MSGTHEPPTKRSFYFSLATSTLRIAIVVAAVVVGVLVLKNAFPNASDALAPAPAGSVGTVTSPSPQTSMAKPPASNSPRPKVKGVKVQVLNGTSRTGLAALVTQTLTAAGYTGKPPGNAALTAHTTVYYQSDQKLNAQGLRDRFFPGALLKPALPSAPADVNVEIVLGDDFKSVGSPISASP